MQLVTLVAAAAAEADPALLYTGWPYTYTLPYTLPKAGCTNEAGALVPCAHGVALGPVTYALPYGRPCTNNAGASVPCNFGGLYHGYYPFGLLPAAAAAAPAEAAVEEARKKREADPAVLYSTSVVKNPLPALNQYIPYAGLHHAYAGLPYTSLPYASVPYAGYAGLGYAGLGYHGLGYGFPYVVQPAATAEDGSVEEARKKREAEAEPEADPYYFYSGYHPYTSYGYNYHPYTYAGYHHPVVYTAPVGCRNYLGSVVPCRV